MGTPISGTYKTTDAVGNREQLIDAIYVAHNGDCPFTTTICGRIAAESTKVDWLTDDLPAPNADNAVAEGGDAGTASNFNPTRVENYTQIFESVYKVSTTQERVKHAGRSSEVGRQAQMATKKLMRDIEAAATSKNAAVSGGTRKMRGAASWLSSNISSGSGGSTNASTGVVTDGTQRALTKAMVDGVLQGMACPSSGFLGQQAA